MHLKLTDLERLPPLTIREAAEILQRSTTWVRNWMALGVIERVTDTETGPIQVTAESVLQVAATRRTTLHPRLRVVIDNTR